MKLEEKAFLIVMLVNEHDEPIFAVEADGKPLT